MKKYYWIKLTKTFLDYKAIISLIDDLPIEIINLIFPLYIWLLNLGASQKDQGHFVIDKSVLITSDNLKEIKLNHNKEIYYDAFNELKKHNMIIYEETKNKFSYEDFLKEF